MARRFVSEGAQVYITGRRQAQLDEAVSAIGGAIEGVAVDSADRAHLQALFDHIKAQHGKLDVLVANAGGGTEAFSVYAASKAAVRSFARNWILDLKGRGIRINTLSPGPIKTPGLVELVGTDSGAQQGFLDHLATLIPMGRVGDPDEIAKAAVFLASDDASFVNGIELFVDGGMRQI
jgi:NAD(P)-dependent dehydrogenase (short-subunit alcohol dehydrogenase family)